MASKIDKLVYAMLTERTAHHLTDSGGIYGRQYERNQAKTIEDFIAEPDEPYVFDAERGELERTVSVFQYLTRYELDDVCDKFNELNTDPPDWEADCDAYGVSVAAWDSLKEYEPEVGRVWNTYNEESDLSQILQCADLRLYVDGQEEDYIIVQVHGGCDARSGYTDAKLFKVPDWLDYISEYKSSSEIDDDLRDGYIQARDYLDPEKIWTSEEILARIEEIEENKV